MIQRAVVVLFMMRFKAVLNCRLQVQGVIKISQREGEEEKVAGREERERE